MFNHKDVASMLMLEDGQPQAGIKFELLDFGIVNRDFESNTFFRSNLHWI